jgi:hypothetical protein
MELNHQVRAHATLSQCSNDCQQSATKAPPSTPHISGHPTSTDSGNYGPAPMDLSAAKILQKQCRHNQWIAKGCCLHCGSVDHFKDQYPILHSSNAQKIHLAATGISTANLDSIPSLALDSGKKSSISSQLALLVNPP